jgi:hypothetical protein
VASRAPSVFDAAAPHAAASQQLPRRYTAVLPARITLRGALAEFEMGCRVIEAVRELHRGWH